MNETFFSIISFLVVTIAVGVISYYKTKNANDSGTKGYFMAGGSLTCWFIAGSMLLTNLSAEQLVGLNGGAFAGNMTQMAWESTAAIATIIMALYFLPRYLSGGFSTLPQFLEERFDVNTRRLVSVIFMIGYTLVANPTALYLGAISINEVFDIDHQLGISREASIWLLVWITGIIGAIYAIFGGLRAVAVSDTINGIILLIASLSIPILGFMALGDGSLIRGVQYIVTHSPEKLNAIGDSKSSVPFGTLFTGMLFANLFFWCTNQMIIQRSLAAKDLAEGQKGVLLTGFIKILVPLVMLIPGIIAYHYFKGSLDRADLAYPALVRAVMPWWFVGFFVAAFFGTVISHFNSIVNSTATLFALDIYQGIRPNVSEEKVIRVGKIASTLFSLASLFIAPLLMYAPDGIFMLVRRFTGFYNIPIIAVVLVGFFAPRVSALPVKISIVSHIVLYAFLIFVLKVETRYNLHFIHLMGILFVVEVAFLLVLGKIFPRETPYIPKWKQAGFTFTPWRYAYITSAFLVGLLVSVYLTFSPIGLANPAGVTTQYYVYLTCVWIAFLLFWIKEQFYTQYQVATDLS